MNPTASLRLARQVLNRLALRRKACRDFDRLDDRLLRDIGVARTRDRHLL